MYNKNQSRKKINVLQVVEGLSNSWQCGSCLAQETATKKRKSEQEEEEETGDQMDTA